MKYDLSRLSPCPFCGGKPCVSEYEDFIAAKIIYLPRWISCGDCDADGPPIHYKFQGTAEDAFEWIAAAWNRRANGE